VGGVGVAAAHAELLLWQPHQWRRAVSAMLRGKLVNNKAARTVDSRRSAGHSQLCGTEGEVTSQ